MTVAAGYGLLPFAAVDWVDTVDAAPIPVGVNFGATRHRQMIEQGGQGAFRTTIDEKGVAWECNHCNWKGGGFYESRPAARPLPSSVAHFTFSFVSCFPPIALAPSQP